MKTNNQGFVLNRHDRFSGQALLANTVRALELLALPLSVASYAKLKRLYFLGERQLSKADKRAIGALIHERFGLVTTLRCLGEALKTYAPAMPPENLAAWREANADAQRERNAANARAERLARNPGLAERRARLERAAERMAEAARLRADRVAKRASKPIKKAPALSRAEWFAGLRWDRSNRIQSLLATTAGASPEHSLTFAQWLAGAARRTIEPGAPAFGIAFRGVPEAVTIMALEALAGPWLGHALSPDAQPTQLRAQVTDRLIVHATARDRREPAIFGILASRTGDFVGDASEPIRRTFALAITLRDDESVPQGFHEVRVTNFDPGALRDVRDLIFAEAKECARAAMSKHNPNEIVRQKRLAWEESYYDR